MRTLIAPLILALTALPVAALALTPSERAPSGDTAAALTITQAGESTILSLKQLEQLDLYDVDMHHPEGLKGEFTGVLVNDLVDAHGLDEATRIRLVAADDYTTFLTPAEREEKQYLLVTRFEGEPIPLDKQGPLMLVVPADAEAVRTGALPMTKWIWSVIEIRAR